MEQTKDFITWMVRKEMQELLANNRETIDELVKTTLFPELKNATRNAILDSLNDLMDETRAEAENDCTIKEQKPGNNYIPKIQHLPDDDCSCEKRSKIENKQSESNRKNTISGGEKEAGDGRYLYGIVECNHEIILETSGIDGNEVYTISYKDISAVVHNCPAEPYKSDDQEVMTAWVLAHQQVVDAAREKFGTILPLGFDTIIQQKEGINPEENTRKWMENDYDNLKAKFEKIRDKAEYGIQVIWDPEVISAKIMQTSPEIKKMQNEINAKPKGIAYMFKQKLEKVLKTEMEKEADRYFKDFFEKIKACVYDVKVEKTKKVEKGKQMLLNLSCLLPEKESEKLGNELEKINNMEGFAVRFTGPWAPYGFV